jgi:hypothetical protein
MYCFGKEIELRQFLQTANITRAIKLFCGSWEIRANFLGLWREHVAFASKVFAIIFPGVVVGLANAPSVLKIGSLSFVLSNITSEPTKTCVPKILC